ncbi:MAG: NAD(P)-dependent oxidoreductase [Gammaproteobacteria bacterium]|jgi:3-hydroxyisobutyrate dehydrogenase-like beta-hydroxyacid dehydrogenase|nr:NAD(P)-dependent oxidoreductase [Gammaproteobacteria bacterium]
MKKTISFLGLGKMGAVMAPLFLQAGHQLTVYNRDPKKATALVDQGAKLACSPQQACDSSDFIFTMLSDDKAIQSVFFDNKGLLSTDVTGKLFIDMSTLQVETVKILSDAVIKQGADFIDAPVSGTVAPAAEGKLMFFCGGEAAVIERATPLLEILSRRIIHAGDIGSGALLKLVVNLPLAVYWQSLAEAVRLGSSGGLNEELMLDAIADSSAALAVLSMKIPTILGADLPVAFDMKSMKKDLNSILTTAQQLNLELPTTTSTLRSYSEAIEKGDMGDKDAVTVVNYLKNKAK